MVQFAGTPNNIPMAEEEKLFAAGVSFLCSKAFPAAYACFARITHKDFCLLYNKALCCFMVGWYDECHKLLCEAEHFVSSSPLSGPERFPEAFLRYFHEEDGPFYPMPQGTPPSLAYTILLRLKAETAFKLQLYEEVKSISGRLSGKFRHIESLISKIRNNDM